MKVITGELSPRSGEVKPPGERMQEAGRAAVEAQPSGSEAPPLSLQSAVKEAVTVSEAARHALEENSSQSVAPWDEAVETLRNRILAKMLQAMEGKRISFADISHLQRLAESQKTEGTPSIAEIERTLEVRASDGVRAIRVSLDIATEGLRNAGFELTEKPGISLEAVDFPGEESQIPFEALRFRIDAGDASSPDPVLGDWRSAGTEPSPVVRVWAAGGKEGVSLLGQLVLNDAALVGFQESNATRRNQGVKVDPVRASTAYQTSQQESTGIGKTSLIL